MAVSVDPIRILEGTVEAVMSSHTPLWKTVWVTAADRTRRVQVPL